MVVFPSQGRIFLENKLQTNKRSFVNFVVSSCVNWLEFTLVVFIFFVSASIFAGEEFSRKNANGFAISFTQNQVYLSNNTVFFCWFSFAIFSTSKICYVFMQSGFSRVCRRCNYLRWEKVTKKIDKKLRCIGREKDSVFEWIK